MFWWCVDRGQLMQSVPEPLRSMSDNDCAVIPAQAHTVSRRYIRSRETTRLLLPKSGIEKASAKHKHNSRGGLSVVLSPPPPIMSKVVITQQQQPQLVLKSVVLMFSTPLGLMAHSQLAARLLCQFIRHQPCTTRPT